MDARRALRIGLTLVFAVVLALGIGALLERDVDVHEPVSPSSESVTRDGSTPSAAELAQVDDEVEREDVATEPDEGSDATSNSKRSRIKVRVVDRSSGTTVPNARLTCFGDSLAKRMSDSRGRATFFVEPGEYSVAAEAPDGSRFLARAYDIDTGEPASEREVSVAPGETAEVDLTLHIGASIHVRIVDSLGRAAPDVPFIWMRGEGNQWVSPVRLRTDSAGAYELRGLEPGWALLGPDPDKQASFGWRKLEVAFGESSSVEFELFPVREVLFRLVDDETGEPIPKPSRSMSLYLSSSDGLAEVIERKKRGARRRAEPVDGPTLQWRIPLSHGAYEIAVWQGSGRGEKWLVRRWTGSFSATVGDTTTTIDLPAELPDVSDVVRIDGRLTHPITKHAHGLSVKAKAVNGWALGGSLNIDEDKVSFRLFVDVDYLEGDTLEFRANDVPFATVRVGDGDQQVTLTPPPPSD